MSNNTEQEYDFNFGVADATNQYVVFTVGETKLAVQILSVQEIIEPLSLHPVPNAVEKFVGVGNLRGELLGVIDLAACCGQEGQQYDQQQLLVFKTENGLQAATVDKVEAVMTIQEDKIDTNPPVRANVPQDFVSGVTEIMDHLVTIIDLKNLLEKEDLIEIADILADAANIKKAS